MSSPDYLAQLTPDALVLYPSRIKLLLFAALSALFVAGGFFMWSNDRNDQLIAIADWVFFGLMLLWFLSRLGQRVPALIVNQSGIFDKSSGLSGYFLRWEEIDSVYISRLGQQRFLSIRLKDPEAFLSGFSGFKARMMRANMKLVGAPLNISANTLPMKLDDLVAAIQQKSPTLRTHTS